jgi:hypothetical protein
MRRILFAVLIVALTLAAIVIVSPANQADACLPCKCPVENPPINCYGPYTFFRHWVPGNAFDIEILAHSPDGNRESVIYVTAAELAELPANPEQHMLVAESPNVYFFKLSYGDYQVNVRSVTEKKIYWAIISAADGHLIEEGDYEATD